MRLHFGAATAQGRVVILAFLVMMLGAFAVYAPSFDNAWLMDDSPVIVDNPDIRSIENFVDNQYPGRPLRELTYLLDHKLFGLEPAGYHIQQNFWHGLNCWLIFLLALRLGASAPVAWGAALLFLVHPINVEVVANISHRKDSLALAFSLLALLAWLQARAGGRMAWPWLAGSAAFWALALLSKENAVVLPLVVLAWEVFRLRPPRNKYWGAGIAAALVAGVLGRIMYLTGDPEFQQQIGRALLKLGTFQGWTPTGYFQTVFKSWAFMWGKLFWPVDLSMEYAFAIPAGWFDPWVIAGLGSMLLLLAAIGWSGRRSLVVCLALVWGVSFWLPTSNLLGHHAYLAADRYWYAPLAGFSILGVQGLWSLIRQRGLLLALFALPLLAVLTWQTWQQQRVWHDAESFNRQILQVNPKSLEGLIGMSSVVEQRGDIEGATSLLAQAQRLSPLDARIPQRLGRLAMTQNRREEAIARFLLAIKLDPGQVESYNDLGSLYDQTGQPEAAIKYLQQALQLNPHFERAYTNLGVVYEGQGRFDEALTMHLRAIRERPDYGEAHYNLGVVCYRMGRLVEARDAFEQASGLLPGDGDALFNLAVVALQLGERTQAAALLPRLTAIDPQRAGSLRELLATENPAGLPKVR